MINKNCNRCGRFRGEVEHICNPIRVIRDGKISYIYPSGQRKLRATKNTRTTKGLQIGYALITWAIIAVSYGGFVALAQTTTPQTATSTPVVATTTEPVHVETIQEKITRYSNKYGVNRDEVNQIVKCETRGTYDPKIQSDYLKGTPRRERSFGLAQIHLRDHPEVTYEQSIDPDFALDFLASHWSKGHYKMWLNCSLKNGYL